MKRAAFGDNRLRRCRSPHANNLIVIVLPGAIQAISNTQLNFAASAARRCPQALPAETMHEHDGNEPKQHVHTLDKRIAASSKIYSLYGSFQSSIYDHVMWCS